MAVRFFIMGVIFLLLTANLSAQERVVYGKLIASLYGSRGANGVVVIELKRGVD